MTTKTFPECLLAHCALLKHRVSPCREQGHHTPQELILGQLKWSDADGASTLVVPRQAQETLFCRWAGEISEDGDVPPTFLVSAVPCTRHFPSCPGSSRGAISMLPEQDQPKKQIIKNLGVKPGPSLGACGAQRSGKNIPGVFGKRGRFRGVFKLLGRRRQY